MSGKILSVFLAIAFVAGFVVLSKADVTGSFDIDITLIPEGAQTEAVKFDIDFQANLQLNITLSGITFGADLGFGVTGVEFVVLSLTTNLGALGVFDQFVFAEPFACDSFPAGVTNTSGGIVGQCSGQLVTPIGDGDGDTVIDRAVGFVKKRIQLELNIAGITLTNLALFEDVDFPDIQGINPSTGLNDHEHDHFGTGTPYFVGAINNDIDDQTPTFGFGDVISISGQTVSGITVTGATALCASGNNYIKKRSWTWEVNKACTGAFGQNRVPIEETGAKTPILFEQEDLSISGIEVGGVSFDIFTTFRPLDPISSTIIASTNILDLADLSVTFTSNNITNLSLSSIVTVLVSGNLTIQLFDFGGDLDIDLSFVTLSVVLNPNQNPADFAITLIAIDGVGLTRADFTLGISRGNINLDSTTRFSGGGNLTWTSTSFSIDVDGGGGINFGADFSYTPIGMGPTAIELDITF